MLLIKMIDYKEIDKVCRTSELRKIIRKNFDIGLMGLKSEGKTLVMSYMLFILYLNGYKVFSNYTLNFPHHKIDSMNDFQKIYDLYDINVNKVVALDDIEYIFSSKFTNKEVSRKISDITLFLGKQNCSFFYSTKRSMAVLIDIRESSTNEFWFPRKVRYKYNSDKFYDEIMDDYLNNYKIVIDRYDVNLDPLKPLEIKGIENLVCLYDTQEMIKGM